MRKVLTAAIVLCLILSPALALADSTLRAQGSATLSAQPDRVKLSVGYACENAESSAAQTETATVVEKIMEALAGLGIAEEAIQTSYLNAYPLYNYNTDTPSLRGYRVEHMLQVAIDDLDMLGEALDAALAAGANQVGSIAYTSSKEDEVYLQALAKAIEAASYKAGAMAIAAGVWLGSLEQVNEVPGYNTPSVRYAETSVMADSKSLGATLSPGNIEITATVELVYEVR